eukprot:SAG31_NODE_8710_length_1401_cov_1.354839_1_plen_59_part_10
MARAAKRRRVVLRYFRDVLRYFATSCGSHASASSAPASRLLLVVRLSPESGGSSLSALS